MTKVAIIILALVGTGAMLSLNREGSVLSADSAIYIGAADNLLAGHGLSVPFGDVINRPLTHHAPFFPVVLAALGLAVGGTLNGARLLAALLFGANMALIGLMTYTVCRSRSWLAIVTGALTLTSVSMLLIHEHAWSEPLFLLLGFGGLLLLAVYLQNEKIGLLVLSAASIGLALLTRYAGVTLAVTGLFGIMVVGRHSPTRRLRSAAIFGVICFAPILLWLARNSIRAGTATNRHIIFHPVGTAQARQVLSTLAGWLLIPDNAPDLLKAVALSLLLGLLIWTVWRIWRDRHVQAIGEEPSQVVIIHPLVWLLIAFVAIYGLFLAASISFLDANTPLDDRILSPVWVATLVLGAFLVDSLLRTARSTSFVRVLVGVIISGFVVVSAARAVAWSSENHTDNFGLMKQAWRNSETIQAVQAITETTTIYSNASDLIYLHTGKPAMTVPRKLDLSTQEPNNDFQAQLRSMAEKMKNEGAILVYFDALSRSTLPTEDELKVELPLQPLIQTADGAIFGIRSDLADTDTKPAEE